MKMREWLLACGKHAEYAHSDLLLAVRAVFGDKRYKPASWSGATRWHPVHTTDGCVVMILLRMAEATKWAGVSSSADRVPSDDAPLLPDGACRGWIVMAILPEFRLADVATQNRNGDWALTTESLYAIEMHKADAYLRRVQDPVERRLRRASFLSAGHEGGRYDSETQRLYGRRLTSDERRGLTPARAIEQERRSGYYYLDAQGGVRVEYYYRM